MNTSNLPEFLTNPTFWFALINMAIMFTPRFGITLTTSEIASINLVVASVFKVAPPINTYVAVKRYEIAEIGRAHV